MSGRLDLNQRPTATVYTLCAHGSLGHVRISTNAIRVPEEELALLIGRRLVPR